MCPQTLQVLLLATKAIRPNASSSYVGVFDARMQRVHAAGEWLSSYLAGGDELERPKGGLHVRDVGLELVESSGDAALDLIGLGPRGGVGRDLVEGGLRHLDGVDRRYLSRVGGKKARNTLLQLSL